MAKPGKYAHLTATLPRLAEDSSYQDRINLVKDFIRAPLAEGEAPMSRAYVAEVVGSMAAAMKLIYQENLRAAPGTPFASSYALAYRDLRDLKQQIDDWESLVNLLLEAYTQLMTTQMEAEGMTTLKMADGRGVSTFLEPYASVKDKDALRDWAMKDPDLKRSLTLQWQTLDSLCKKLLLAGEDLPPGVEMWAKTKVRIGG